MTNPELAVIAGALTSYVTMFLSMLYVLGCNPTRHIIKPTTEAAVIFFIVSLGPSMLGLMVAGAMVVYQ